MTSLGTIIGRGTLASRPAAGTPGALYYATDGNGTLYRDNGSSWDSVTPGSSFSGEVAGTDLSLTGLTGSTSTFRFVGANASGAPASGAHNTNDVALDIAGKEWWLCTAGGTPGTWAAMGGGGGSSTLAGDTDVAIASPAQGQVLGYDGSAWVNVGGMQKIAESVLGGTAASITFSSIPGTFRHLVLIMSGRGDKAAAQCNLSMQFNSDTAANYDWVNTFTQATSGWNIESESFAASSLDIASFAASTAPTGSVGHIEISIPNYAGTTLHKSCRTQAFLKRGTASGDIPLEQKGGLWRSTSAITAIKVSPDSGNFVSGSVFTLYGVS